MNDDDLPPLIETPPGRYRHYKGGEYEVLGTVRHSETLEPMTLYRALYGERGLWVRPAPCSAAAWTSTARRDCVSRGSKRINETPRIVSFCFSQPGRNCLRVNPMFVH